MLHHQSIIQILFILLAFSPFAIGQKLLVSDPIDISNETDYQLIARYNDQLLLYRKSGNKVSIQSFLDKDLKENWIKTVEFEKNDMTTITVIPSTESFFILYYHYKKNHTYIRLKELNLDVEEINDIEVGTFEEPCYLKKHHVVFSEDKSQFLIYLTSLMNNELELINFDLKQQQKRWQKKIKFEKESPSTPMEYLLINNTGTIYIVFNEDNSKVKRKTHHFNIYTILLDVEKNVEKSLYRVPFEDYISYDMEIEYDEKNNQLVAAGLYSNENNLANGIFYFKTTLIGSAPNIQLTEFDEIFMRSLTGKKNKKIVGVQNFKICPLILRNDGGVLLIAEQQFAFQSTGSFYLDDNTKNHSDFLYENVLLASIHPTGQVYWKEILFKSQRSENDNAQYSSFFAFTTNSNIRFLYNNDISWSTSIFEYVVSGNGKVQRNVVAHQERKNGVLPFFIDSIQLSASEVVSLSERNNKLQIVKINY